jgi:hypothetical protein
MVMNSRLVNIYEREASTSNFFGKDKPGGAGGGGEGGFLGLFTV